jgi:hypothetical protein
LMMPPSSVPKLETSEGKFGWAERIVSRRLTLHSHSQRRAFGDFTSTRESTMRLTPFWNDGWKFFANNSPFVFCQKQRLFTRGDGGA